MPLEDKVTLYLASEQVKITVLCDDEDILERILKISSIFDSVTTVNDMEQAMSSTDKRTVLIVQEDLFEKRAGQSQKAIIVVTDNFMDIKSSSVNYIPKELYMTKYLDEFILWSLAKSQDIVRRKKKASKKKDIEKIITDLQSLSRCSLFRNTING